MYEAVTHKYKNIPAPDQEKLWDHLVHQYDEQRWVQNWSSVRYPGLSDPMTLNVRLMFVWDHTFLYGKSLYGPQDPLKFAYVVAGSFPSLAKDLWSSIVWYMWANLYSMVWQTMTDLTLEEFKKYLVDTLGFKLVKVTVNKGLHIYQHSRWPGPEGRYLTFSKKDTKPYDSWICQAKVIARQAEDVAAREKIQEASVLNEVWEREQHQKKLITISRDVSRASSPNVSPGPTPRGYLRKRGESPRPPPRLATTADQSDSCLRRGIHCGLKTPTLTPRGPREYMDAIEEEEKFARQRSRSSSRQEKFKF